MSDDTADEAFDPGKHLSKLGRSDYLEVKWRLVWLRDRHPDAAITTELVTHDGQFAIFKAHVTVPGGGSATGWGSEGMDDFRDYIEKAETKAIGRALAALGFGTQFCEDFDFGASEGKVVDSPIDFSSTRGRRLNNVSHMPLDHTEAGVPTGASHAATNRSGQPTASPNNPISPAQAKFLNGLAKDLGMVVIAPDGSDHHDEQAMNAETRKRFGKAVTELSAKEASELIEDWKARPKVARR